MRLKTLENQMRVFMNPHDFETMLDAADSRRAHLAMLLMGLCSFRVDELLKIVLDDIRESTHPDVEIRFWPIYGKDTKQRDTEGKLREVWVPDRAREAVEEYYQIENKSDDDSVFNCAKRTLQKDVERSRKTAVAKTGVGNYQYVSAHDFRAYFATNMALRENVKEEIVMELGGWDDRETFRKAYLDAQFDDIIQQHLAMAGVVDVEVETAVTEYQILRSEIQDLKALIEDLELEPVVVDARGEQRDTSTPPDETDLGDWTE